MRKRRAAVSRTRGLRLDERARRTERTIERYRKKPFSWTGANCIRLAAAQARAMGHKVPPVPLFRSVEGARRALAAEGFDSVTALLDAHFDRLPSPAFAWVGDLCAGPASDEHGLEAIGISDGQGNLFGWHAANGFTELAVIKFAAADLTAAWRL